MASLRFRSVAGSIALVLLVGCGGGGSNGASQGKTTPVASLPPASTPVTGQSTTAPTVPTPVTSAPAESAATGELPAVDETPSDLSAPSQLAEVPAGESPTDPSLGAPVDALPPEAPGHGTAQLSWAAPVDNADGSSLNKLSGYRIKYGRSKKDLDRSVFIENPSVSTYVIEDLQPGTWYFEVIAISGDSIEGPPSNQAQKVIA